MRAAAQVALATIAIAKMSKNVCAGGLRGVEVGVGRAAAFSFWRVRGDRGAFAARKSAAVEVNFPPH